jgi:hypothetical protein
MKGSGSGSVPKCHGSRTLKNLRWNVQQCVVSGSKDCCIKVWNLDLGLQLKSIYTFNTITRLQLLPHRLVSD